MKDLESDLGVEPDEFGTAGLQPETRRPDEMSGEYRDTVSYRLLFASAIVGGFFLWIYLGLAVLSGPAVPIFALFLPLASLFVIYRALNVAIVGFDRSGWRYRREIFGHTLETEEGRWRDIAQTDYRQWAMGPTRASNAFTIFGELSMRDSSGKAVLKAQTTFYERGNPGANHVPGKRQIGLSEPDFETFVSLINDETPQLGYEWVLQTRDYRPLQNRFVRMFYADPGQDRYARVPRGARAGAGEYTEGTSSDSVPLPTPF